MDKQELQFFKLMKESATAEEAEFCVQSLLDAGLPINAKIYGIDLPILLGVLLAAVDLLPSEEEADEDEEETGPVVMKSSKK